MLAATATEAGGCVPAWLKDVSGLYKEATLLSTTTDDDADADADAEDDDEDTFFQAPLLPVCAMDCADGAQYYRTLGAWCVPWADVPHAPFLAAWLALDAAERRALLEQYGAFAEELDVNRWRRKMVLRDDVAMFAAVVAIADNDPAVSSADTDWVDCMHLVYIGAIRCLRFWAQRQCARGRWAPGAWTDLQSPSAVCWWFKGACELAAANKDLAMLRLLHEQGGCPFGNTYATSAGNGFLEGLQYAHEQGCRADLFVTSDAAKNGHLHCLVYLHEQGCVWWSSALTDACAHGHLDCLVYAREHGCEWPEHGDALLAAATYGHLDCVKYACNNGCPRGNDFICTRAAQFGHFDCLVYLREHGCPITIWASYNACRFGHADCFRYAFEQLFVPGVSHAGKWCSTAARSGNLECLQYATMVEDSEWDKQECLRNTAPENKTMREWIKLQMKCGGGGGGGEKNSFSSKKKPKKNGSDRLRRRERERQRLLLEEEQNEHNFQQH